ncbi:MAG: hypothetical protein RJB66_1606 [Pseudomonadota bacterium]|jgi:hypothetical protein
MKVWVFAALSLISFLLASIQVGAQTPFPEIDRTQFELQYHVISNDRAIGEKLETLGIDDKAEIAAFDVEKTSEGIEAIPRANGLLKIKKWATSHVRSLHTSYCLMRLAFNSSVTGWVLYRFYDLTYLHPTSIISGAAMAGALSLTFMAYSIPMDRWIMKSKALYGQFARFTLISVLYMAALKTSYLSTELLIQGSDFLSANLLKAELMQMIKAFGTSAAPMFFVFWNAYRKENRDAAIEATNKPHEQKEFEHAYERVISQTASFFGSMTTNTVGLLSSTTSIAAFDFASYAITLGAGSLFLKEHRVRSRRMKTCQFALQGQH